MVRHGGHDPQRRAGQRGHLPLSGPRLLQRVQYAVSPPQDLGSRRRHQHAAGRPLAGRHQGPRRTAPHAGPHDRHRPHDSRRARHREADRVGGRTDTAGAGPEPGSSVCEQTSPSTATFSGGCTKATERFASATGSWSPPRAIRGSCTTSQPTAPNPTIWQTSIPRRRRNWKLSGIGNWRRPAAWQGKRRRSDDRKDQQRRPRRPQNSVGRGLTDNRRVRQGEGCHQNVATK